MKIYYITPYSVRTVNGVSTVITQLSKGLKKRNIDYLVISGRQGDEIGIDMAIKAIEIDVRNIPNFRDVYQGVKILKILLQKRQDFDLIHVHSPYLQAMLAAIMGKVLGKPVISTIHGKFPKTRKLLKRPYLWATIKGTIAFSDQMTFVDEESKKHYNIPSSIVIENGMDVEENSPDTEARNKTRLNLNLDDDEVVLLYLGRIVGHKGIYDVLNALYELKKQPNFNLKMLIVGSGELEKTARKIEELGLKEFVNLVGKQKEVIDFYRASDIFVLFTSPFEGLPMTLLEASSMGLAIISSNVAGIPRLIKNETSGILLEYGDKKGLMQAINRLAEDKELREHLGKNARKRVIEDYNIEKTVDRYVDLYKKLLQNR
jgi:glycosyltransferase involved in cell wall biosynthesis